MNLDELVNVSRQQFIDATEKFKLLGYSHFRSHDCLILSVGDYEYSEKQGGETAGRIYFWDDGDVKYFLFPKYIR